MSPRLQYECTRVPVTALTCVGPLLIVAEGPYLRFYGRQDNGYISSERVFQTQAIHGISTFSQSTHHVSLVIWGGRLVRSLELQFIPDKEAQTSLGVKQLSNVVKAPDWILDLCSISSPSRDALPVRCAAVTAHNALLEVTTHKDLQKKGIEGSLSVSVRELTSSLRSILYSAHLLWESEDRVLVAAGTAFGELMYWSWDRSLDADSRSRVHRVFLGHEGSIFGVRISGNLTINDQHSRRLLASCSDDRTIRIWNVSDMAAEEKASVIGDLELQRTRHTGFSNPSFDTDISNVDCVAIGWGHTSRVWKVEFLDSTLSSDNVFLISSGEDATSRTWKLITEVDEKLVKPDSPPWRLELVDTAAYHNGKNIWSMSIPRASNNHQITLGGADSKITAFPLPLFRFPNENFRTSEYNVEDITASAATLGEQSPFRRSGHRSSKQAEFLRSYAFLDGSSFVLTTNSGKVHLETLSLEDSARISSSKLIAQKDDLTGYSVCAGQRTLGIVFIAGARGSLYAYTSKTTCLTKLHTVSGKIGEMFTEISGESSESKQVVLLITLVGKKAAQLLRIHLSESGSPSVLQATDIPISDQLTGLAITSMTHMQTPTSPYILLGFRRGSIALYRFSSEPSAPATLLKIIESVHGKEAVTALFLLPSIPNSETGHLVSTGRDARLAIHILDLSNANTRLIHNLALPLGPNIEGLYFHRDQLYVYGFSSKKFIVYNTATEEEIMSVETGGAHRSWAFMPELDADGRGGDKLLWTRASSLHIRGQRGANHTVIRSGAHGREIKAVAVAPVRKGERQLIATGAEDTDIKISTYMPTDTNGNAHFTCLRTLRKHTTGIQHLQWSADGQYLFSSGGCEEFYVWRVDALPKKLGGVGVVCEAVCTPESEDSDLRIMSFNVFPHSDSEEFTIGMVFSNSAVKIYNYIPTAEQKWQTLLTTTYTTTCLTQTAFLPPSPTSTSTSTPTLLTASTDGHIAFFALPSSANTAQNPTYHTNLRMHTSSSKTLATHLLPNNQGTLAVSGGDDATLTFLFFPPSSHSTPPSPFPPIAIPRAHASAITACAILVYPQTHARSNSPNEDMGESSKLCVITSGNDQWVRLWTVDILPSRAGNLGGEDRDWMHVRRAGRWKTSVADVSSMAVLHSEEEEKGGAGGGKRVMICGVGVEVLRLD